MTGSSECPRTASQDVREKANCTFHIAVIMAVRFGRPLLVPWDCIDALPAGLHQKNLRKGNFTDREA